MGFIARFSDLVWSPPVIGAFLAAGIFVSIKTGFIQLCFARWIKGMTLSESGGEGKVSPWKAAATALGGALGTGNISGVAWAVALGGPGAIFWMWVSALVGMALSYAEKVLTLMHIKNNAGGAVGGAMCYIEKALGKKAGVFYCIVCLLALYTGGCMTQSSAMCSSLSALVSIDMPVLGLLAALAVFTVSRGGIERTSRVSAVLVSAVSVLYIVVGGAALWQARQSIGSVFATIVRSAFDISPTAAGISAFSAMRYGFARGIFSSEAGVGSATIPHASAKNSPHGQGCWGIFEVFLDTAVICTLTGLIILSSPFSSSALTGEKLTTAAFSSLLGSLAPDFIALCITVLAFSTLISKAWCARQCINYLHPIKGTGIAADVCFALFALSGAILPARALWDASDALNLLLALPNLTALCLFSKELSLSKDSKALK